MINKYKKFAIFIFLFVFSLCSSFAYANNLVISNVSLEDRNENANTAVVEFDISWDNSWRDDVNYDAAWVFLKVCVDSCTDGQWDHGDLYTYGKNPSNSSPGSNSDLDIIVPADKVGAFIQRKSSGTGTVSSNDVRLTLDYNSVSASDTSTIRVKVMGIEMVYIPEGAFYVGDGNGTYESNGSLHAAAVTNTAFYCTTTLTSVTSDFEGGADPNLPVNIDCDGGVGDNFAWPTGYKPYYLMKYELTQGQYRDFLNMLDRDEQTTRVKEIGTASDYAMTDNTTVTKRDTIRLPATLDGTNPEVFGCDYAENSEAGDGVYNQADDGEGIAMNYMKWADMAAYTDWAGLRPFTELEYEKAARGPNSAVYEEYAWGSTAIEAATTSLTDEGKRTERPDQGNTNYHSSAPSGPFRVGSFASTGTSRKSAGAGYYGNLDLTGNIFEMIVFIGDTDGQAFDGTHGDGTLTSTASYEGNATNNDWPGINATSARGVTGSAGAGGTGGAHTQAGVDDLLVSMRGLRMSSLTTRSNLLGGRAARTSPYDGHETVLFLTTLAQNGDFNSGSGARVGLDAYCMGNKPSNLPEECADVHAFISVSGSDEIRDMPFLYQYNQFNPVYLWHNTDKQFNMLALDWQDMFDSLIMTSVWTGTGDNSVYWTGSTAAGASSTNCQTWNSGSDLFGGIEGEVGVIDGAWLAGGADNCDETNDLLCACKYDVE